MYATLNREIKCAHSQQICLKNLLLAFKLANDFYMVTQNKQNKKYYLKQSVNYCLRRVIQRTVKKVPTFILVPYK